MSGPADDDGGAATGGPVTCERFAACIEDVFRVHGAPVDADLELVEATPMAPQPTASGGRAPFTLLFRGPAEPALVQGLYQLRHPALGEAAIFLVPVGADQRGLLYEAVFN